MLWFAGYLIRATLSIESIVHALILCGQKRLLNNIIIMVLKLVSFCTLLQLICCYNHSSTATTSNPGCDEPEGLCLCYHELEDSLLATENNRINLSTAFFPLEDNQPEFVTVRYSFDGSNMTQLWFWSTQMSHFLHPFEVFQFLSLFFTKPEPYYTGNLDIVLKAECANLSSTDVKLQLLTQRLKYYAEIQTTSIILRDPHTAKAYSMESLGRLLLKNSGRTTNVIICTAIFVIVLACFIVATLFFVFFHLESHTKSNWIKKAEKKQSVVLSLTVLSFISIIYIICLASTALGFWNYRGDDELRNLFHSSQNLVRQNLAPITVALIVDVLCLITFLAIVYRAVKTFNIVQNCQNKCKCAPCEHTTCHCINCKKCSDTCSSCNHCQSCTACSVKMISPMVILSATVICPILSIIAHSPYIAIAYLNDGDHASSIFIYYTVIAYIIFGVSWLFFHWCKHFEIDEKRSKTMITLVSLVFILFLFLGLVVVISCYFVLIPINKATSDAPTRILSIFKSGGFLVGSFIVYKVLKYFHTKDKKSKKEEEIGILVHNIHDMLQPGLNKKDSV